MRLVFFGSGSFGLPTLEALAQQHEVALVVTQPDRPAGRRQNLTATPIAGAASALGLPIIKPEQPNDPSIIQQIHALKPDAFVVIAFGHKLGRELLDEIFAINLHGSLLPKFRGAAPIHWAMILGERETGISVITLAQRMDAGEILAQVSTPIDPNETAGELHDRLAALGPQAVLGVLDAQQKGTLRKKVQDDSRASRAPKLTKADGTVRFDQPATVVRARIHGLTPWPGCTVRIDGEQVKLIRAEVVDDQVAPGEPGELDAAGIVTCQPGSIRLIEVLPAGRRAMSFEDYRRGRACGDAPLRCMPR